MHYALKQLSLDYSSEHQCLRNNNLSDGLSLIPIQKNNLTSLSRLAVRVYCLRLDALLAYFFELVLHPLPLLKADKIDTLRRSIYRCGN